MKYRLLYLFLSMLPLTGFAQESLRDLQFNQALQAKQKNRVENRGSSRDVLRDPVIFLIDTLDLPFIDDFSRDYIKKYNSDNIDDIRVHYGFTVNGEHPATLDLIFSPTYSKTKLVTGDIVEDENPKLIVTYYTKGKPTGTDTGWTNIITEMDQSLGLVSYDTLDPETTLINTFDTFYVVFDDTSLWVTPADEPGRGGPYINNSFATDMLTQGVATFDGTDALGMPYDISAETTHGAADTLESKPLNIDSNSENIFLSFFYQFGGLGNAPEPEDSLVLEFFNVQDSTWDHVWGALADESPADGWSEQVFKRIAGPKYQRPGFKFRFRNYATLSGSFDHWHIDYIRLDENRDSIAEDTLYDVAFVSAMSSFTGKYTAVPYSHYLDDPTALQASTATFSIRNLSPFDVFVSGLNYTVKDPDGNPVLSATTTEPNLPAGTLGIFNTDLPASQIFPDIGEECATFSIHNSYVVTGNNDLTINDAILSEQEFCNYYAYDDGSAEKAYALTGAGLMLAYEFTPSMSDSLKAFLINFPQAEHNQNEDLAIELMVWDDLGFAPIYTSSFFIYPQYTNANEFQRYELEEPLFIDGKFYIGFRQMESTTVFIGMDMNHVSNDKINYKVGDEWFTSSFEGSLLMRPDFGDAPQTTAVPDEPHTDLEVRLYPNPAKDQVSVTTNSGQPVILSVFTITGDLALQATVRDRENIDTSRLQPGLYLVEIRDTHSTSTQTLKLVVTD